MITEKFNDFRIPPLLPNAEKMLSYYNKLFKQYKVKMKTEKNTTSWLKKLKKTFWFLVKIALAGGIVAVLVGRDTSAIEKGFETFDYVWLIPAALLYFGHMVICALRWHSLTKVLNIDLSRTEALSLTMQAYFFSLVVPGGAIGGDLVKIGVLSSRAKEGTKVEGAFTILMDRIVGMIALFALAIAITIPAIPTLMKISIPDIPLTDAMKTLCIAGLFSLCFAGLAASAAIFFHRQLEMIPPIGFLMRKADGWTHGMVTRMTTATDVYRAHWQVPFRAVLVSIPFVHLMTVAVFFCLAMGLKADGATFLTLVAAVTIGNIVGLIPIFPSGIGGRDVAVITILVAGGMLAGEAKTAQLLYTALMIGCNLLAGLFFIIDPGRKKSKERRITEEVAS